MDALDFFLTRYAEFRLTLADELMGELGESQVRRRPHAGVLPIAWLLWHIARIEDVGVNRFVADRAQVLDAGGWLARLGIARRDVGTGMTDAEADALGAAVDLGALRGYLDAVSRATLEVVDGLRGVDLAAVVPADRVARTCRDEGAVIPGARWLEEFWAKGRTRAWYLAQTPLLHAYGHAFEARVARGLWGRPSR